MTIESITINGVTVSVVKDEGIRINNDVVISHDSVRALLSALDMLGYDLSGFEPKE